MHEIAFQKMLERKLQNKKASPNSEAKSSISLYYDSLKYHINNVFWDTRMSEQNVEFVKFVAKRNAEAESRKRRYVKSRILTFLYTRGVFKYLLYLRQSGTVAF